MVQALPPDMVNEVADLLEEVLETVPYNMLKTAILKGMGQSNEQMIQFLFNNISLGDRTLSQLLQHMRCHISGNHLFKPILRHLWLGKLLTSVVQISILMKDVGSFPGCSAR